MAMAMTMAKHGKSPCYSWENHGKTMGKPWENGDLYGKSQFLMGKSTISMAMFNGKLLVHQRVNMITI